MTNFTESAIEQAAIDWLKETLKVSFVNTRHIGQRGLANQDEGQRGKPLGSKTEVRALVRLWDGMSLPRVMMGEVRVKDVENL